MKSQVEKNVILAPFTTFSMGGPAQFFTEVVDENDLPELQALAESNNVKIFVLGGGSNIVVTDSPLPILALKISLRGMAVVEDTPSYQKIKFAGGEVWDDAVAYAVEHGLAGIEALSAIPGSVGAAPVQNIGAYGQELKDALEEVRVYDLTTRTFNTLSNADCRFAYRDSIFKQEGRSRYIITSITLKLSKNPPAAPTYPALINALAKRNITSPTLADIRDTVVATRASKLPDPKIIPNVGSFFGNPTITAERLAELKTDWPNIVNFHQPSGDFKISAGWLIEQCGLKGESVGKLKTHNQSALVLTNPNHATFAETVAARDLIATAVQNKFGIALQTEPSFIE